MNVKAVINSNVFGRAILGVILFNALLIGVSTYGYTPQVQPYLGLIHTLEWVCIWIFVAELTLKFYARKDTRSFFSNRWNIFDILVVGSAFVPNISTIATLLRVLRVFRVLRLVDGLRELRLIVTVLIRSLSSMVYIALLMFICFYIYGVLGVELFRAGQPNEYGSLHEAFFSLFRSLTCEDWTDLRYNGLPHGNYWIVTVFHVSWIMISTFLLINLVVGAVLNNYQEAHASERQKCKAEAPETLDSRIAALSRELNELLEQKLNQTPPAGVNG
jgi:voltage-gated sodium channel